MNCSICGKESAWTVCEDCVKDHNSPRTTSIWKNNRETAEQLADAYYGHALESCGKNTVKKDSKQTLASTLFAIESTWASTSSCLSWMMHNSKP